MPAHRSPPPRTSHRSHGVAQSPTVAVSYVLLAGVMFACKWLAVKQGLMPVENALPHGHGFEVIPSPKDADRPSSAETAVPAEGLALAAAK